VKETLARYAEDVRRIVLVELERQEDWSLPFDLLLDAVEANGHGRRPAHLREQLTWLSEVAQAIDFRQVGEMWIATINERGRSHVRRTLVIAGVARMPERRG